MVGRRGLKGGRCGAISDRIRGRKRHLRKEIGLNTEAGKVGNLPSLASELGVSSFYSSFRFHKGLVSVQFVEFLVVFFFSLIHKILSKCQPTTPPQVLQ